MLAQISWTGEPRREGCFAQMCICAEFCWRGKRRLFADKMLAGQSFVGERGEEIFFYCLQEAYLFVHLQRSSVMYVQQATRRS